MDNMWILAQAPGQDSPGVGAEAVTEQDETEFIVQDSNVPGAKGPVRSPFGFPNILFFGLMFLVMYMLLFRGPRKKQQQQRKMMQNLKKNDKIRTIGGIIGTIVDVKDDEITLKIDESNNTKIKIAVSAVGKNLSEGN